MGIFEEKQRKTQPGTSPEDWVDLYGDSLYSYALYRVRSPQIAEDLLQETFVAALKSRSNYKGQSSEKTWLTGILKHKIIDYLRKESREQLTDNIDGYMDSSNDFFDEKGKWRSGPGHWTFDPSALLDKKEFWKIFYDCLAALPVRLAQAFMLREMDGLDGSEICKVLNISSTNCWVMLYRARMNLKHCLGLNWFGDIEVEGK